MRDLLIGEYGQKVGRVTGKIHYYKGLSDGTLAADAPIVCGGKQYLGRYVSPCVVDWNNDGLLDIILGHTQWTTDNDTVGGDSACSTLFINKGTKEAYLFDTGTVLKTKTGTKIFAKYGRTQFRVADLDKDGKKDLIMCGWTATAGGEPWYFYRNIGTDSAPELAEAITIKYKNNTVLYAGPVHCNARFDLWDWDNDGFKDIIYAEYRQGEVNPVRRCLAEPFTTLAEQYKQKSGKRGAVCVLGNVIIVTNLNKPATLTIYCLNGKRIIKRDIGKNIPESKISIRGLAQGIYFGILEENGEKIQRFMISITGK